MRKWSAIIPLRAGSKGLPKKNIRMLVGKPLYMHAVDVALEAGASRIIITTDIEELFTVELDSRVVVIKRPSELCDDAVPMAPVVLHAIEHAVISGPVVLLQATSPLRQACDLHSALDALSCGPFDLVMSVTDADPSVLKWGKVLADGTYAPISNPEFCFSNRQSLGLLYKPNGAIYAMHAEWFYENKGFVTEKMGAIIMPSSRSVDIDGLADFQLCEKYLNLKMDGDSV